MTKQQKSKIEKITKLFQKIREKTADGDYIFRGENKHNNKISSKLYRQYKEIESKNFDLKVVQDEMLKEAKQYTTLKDGEILTEMQHYGGATNYIDFTSDYLTALFFACDGESKKNGRIILFKKETSNENNKIIEPATQNNRVLLQKSIFALSKKGYLKKTEVIIIKIESNLKTHILKYLKKHHDISTATIYKDTLGYIQIQKAHKSYYAEFFKGLTKHKKGDYEQAIYHYNKSIELNPNIANAYYNRGNAKADLGDMATDPAEKTTHYQQVLADFNEVIRFKPDKASAYIGRGTAKLALGHPQEAIADYNKAKEKALAQGDQEFTEKAQAMIDKIKSLITPPKPKPKK